MPAKISNHSCHQSPARRPRPAHRRPADSIGIAAPFEDVEAVVVEGTSRARIS